MAPRKVGFAEGFRCLLQGLRMAYGRRHGLARYWLLPMLLALAIVAGAWVLLWVFSDDVVRLVWSEPALEAWHGVQHALWRLVALIVFLASAGLAALSAVLLFSLLTVPVNDLLSERVEGVLGTWTPRPFSIRFLLADLVRGVAYLLVRFCLKMLWLVPLFLVSLAVPVVGQLAYVVVGGWFACKYTGLDYLDWCAARRALSWRDRLAVGKANRLAVVGLGAGVVLSLLVPFLFVVVWPGAVAGGTILFLKLHGAVDDAQVERLLRARGLTSRLLPNHDRASSSAPRAASV